MTVVHMTDEGQVTLPKDIRDHHGFGVGSAFAVLETHSGHVILRPVSAEPEMDLVDHLLRLKGIKIPECQHLCPPRADLSVGHYETRFRSDADEFGM